MGRVNTNKIPTLAFLLVAIGLGSLLVTIPNVRAQTPITSITSLQSPASTSVTDGATVKVSVTYNVPSSGYYFAVALWDLNAEGYALGAAQSANRSCMPQLFSSVALCGYVASTSGSDTVTFNFGFSTEGTYSLAAIAFVANSTQVISDSISSRNFTIEVTPAKFLLTLRVPSQVSASIDGVVQSPGAVQTSLFSGVHVISVPEVVDTKTPGVRLRFDHWSDGHAAIPSRAVYLQAASMLEAVYVTQYSLTLSTPYGVATGGGWYDADSSVQISILPTSEPMTGLLGSLGGKWTFQGWYAGQVSVPLLGKSSSASVTVYTPTNLTAHWAADYSIPALIIGIVAGLVIVIVVVLITRRRPAAASVVTSQTQPIQV